MTLYELLLFLHIAFAIVWIGSGFLFHILGYRADRADDHAAIERLFRDQTALANLIFIPSSLLVLAFGIWLTIEGPWSFGDLWIVLGLVGYGLTFLTGVLWIAPQSRRAAEMMARDGGLSPEAEFVARRMTTFARLDMAVLFIVVLDMAVKPTGDDVGTLVLMAALVVAAAAYFGWRARSLPRPALAVGPGGQIA
jgi:uncharacterized membrane protein